MKIAFPITAMLSLSLAAGCGTQTTSSGPASAGKTPEKVTPPAGLIHPADTGAQLNPQSIEFHPAYKLENQSDAGIPSDVGDEPSQAFMVQIGKPVVGLVGSGMDELDYYKVNLPGGKKYRLSIITGKTSANVSMAIYDATGKVELNSLWDIDPDAQATLEFPAGASGLYYFAVEKMTVGGPYKIVVEEI